MSEEEPFSRTTGEATISGFGKRAPAREHAEWSRTKHALSPRESQRGSHPWVVSCGRASRGVLGSSLVLELFLMGWVGSRAEAEPGGQQGPRPPNAAEIFLIPLCGQAHSPACSVEDFISPFRDFCQNWKQRKRHGREETRVASHSQFRTVPRWAPWASP